MTFRIGSFLIKDDVYLCRNGEMKLKRDVVILFKKINEDGLEC